MGMIKRNLPLIILLVLLAAWAIFLNKTADVFVFGFQRNEYSYHPAFTEVAFRAADDSILTALYAPAKKGHPTLLIFHGNKQNIYTFQNLMAPYVQEGYGILMFDYRGYGKSEGKPSESNMNEDGLAALNYLMEKKLISPQEIVLWGFSLGSAPALYTAAQHTDWPFKAIILQSPFTNITDMAFYTIARLNRDSALAPLLSVLLKPFLWDKQFDSTQYLKDIFVPILVGSSMEDKVVPFTLSNALVAASPITIHTFTAQRGEHDNPVWFQTTVENFLAHLNR